MVVNWMTKSGVGVLAPVKYILFPKEKALNHED